MISRRQFTQALAYLALGGLASNVSAMSGMSRKTGSGLGKLVADPKRILDLPAGFQYQIISQLGDPMKDGMKVPDRADGMGCIGLDNERVVLIRNHELQPKHLADQHFNLPAPMIEKAYDKTKGGQPLPGGTTTLVYNMKTGNVEYQFMSLLGTVRNCSGGITPWGNWLTCEESVDTPSSSDVNASHGFVFEVPANATSLIQATPIRSMGRFNHEAACVDPETGIVYMTEDRGDSLFYRFIPNTPGTLHAGGKLQAMAIKGKPGFDTRNWEAALFSRNNELECEWIDLDDVESPQDDLRLRGHTQGAALFARGEGIIFGENELYFCCTNGGAKKLGQIMRYSLRGEQPTISLFLESEHPASFNYGDNLCIAPNGHLMVCEDQYTDIVDNHLKGITPEGVSYDFARLHWQTEPAGTCFSPDGSTLFVNLYSPATTLAITGPWQRLSNVS